MCKVESCSNSVYCKEKCKRHYHLEYRELNKEKISTQKKNYREINKESLKKIAKEKRQTSEYKEYFNSYFKKWYQENKKAHSNRTKRWVEQNKERMQKIRKEWENNNLQRVRFKNSKRRAIKKRSIPNWANKEELYQVYLNCPKGKHVDHIIPISNKNVCGLHVPWNLQYLDIEQNCRKSNKFDFTYDNNTWLTTNNKE
jgi:hypothetical protein